MSEPVYVGRAEGCGGRTGQGSWCASHATRPSCVVWLTRAVVGLGQSGGTVQSPQRAPDLSTGKITVRMAADPAAKSAAALDPANIESIYRAHVGPCHRLAVRVVRDPHLAEDVVQDVFASVVSNPGRFDPARGSLSTWLLTLTHHKAVDLVRRQDRRTRLNAREDLASIVADVVAPPDQLVVEMVDRSRIRTALANLDHGEREVIVLAYFEGYSQSQIAKLTSLPLGTVKSRTLRAMRHLAERLS